MAVNPGQVVTGVFGIPGQLLSLRDLVEKIYTDSLRAGMWPSHLGNMPATIAAVNKSMEQWRKDWHLDGTEHVPAIAEGYWSPEQRSGMINRWKEIENNIRLIRKEVTKFQGKMWKPAKALSWQSLDIVMKHLKETKNLVANLDTEAKAALRASWSLDEGREIEHRDRLQHQVYLLSYATTCSQRSDTLRELVSGYKAPEQWTTTISCTQDLAIDITPGDGKKKRLVALKDLSYNKVEKHYTRFTNLQFEEDVDRDEGPAIRLPGTFPPDLDKTSLWLPLMQVGSSGSPSPGEIANLKGSIGEALQSLSDTEVTQEAIWLNIAQTGSPPKYFSFSYADNVQRPRKRDMKQKRVALSVVNMDKAGQSELALKVAESALLWRFYGIEADICSCRIRSIPANTTAPDQRPVSVLAFEFATLPQTKICTEQWHKTLMDKDPGEGFGSVGIFLAELILGKNLDSLKNLCKDSVDTQEEMFNACNKVNHEIEKIEWITNEARSAVIQAMRLKTLESGDHDSIYRDIAKW